MRTSLVPGLLETMGRNTTRQVRQPQTVRDRKDILGPTEATRPPKKRRCSRRSGPGAGRKQHGTPRRCPVIFSISKVPLKGCSQGLGIGGWQFAAMPASILLLYTKPGYTATIAAGKHPAGSGRGVAPRGDRQLRLKADRIHLRTGHGTAGGFEPRNARRRRADSQISGRRTGYYLDHRPGYRSRSRIAAHRIPGGRRWWKRCSCSTCIRATRSRPGKRAYRCGSFTDRPTRTLEDQEVQALHEAMTGRLIERFDAALPA